MAIGRGLTTSKTYVAKQTAPPLNPSDSDMLALLGFTFVVPVAALFVGFGVAGWVSAFVAFILAAAAVGGYACFYSKTKLPRKTDCIPCVTREVGTLLVMPQMR